ncbi:hypothetical protein LA080_007748 [Diaporthe eres]|nr:hypothetical protein LA080_007748 [Diaporthe eres]
MVIHGGFRSIIKPRAISHPGEATARWRVAELSGLSPCGRDGPAPLRPLFALPMDANKRLDEPVLDT